MLVYGFPLHVRHLRRHGDSRYEVVLAPIQDPIPVAPVFPPGNPSLESRLLLVLRLLPLAFPPHVEDLQVTTMADPCNDLDQQARHRIGEEILQRIQIPSSLTSW